MDEILLLLLNIDGTDGHSICFEMRVANTHAWREGEGPRLEGMLTADADRPHVRINALVECCLRSGDVVFSPQIRGFRDNLGSSEVLRAVECEAVAVNFVANRGDGTSQRTFAVLEGSANGVVLTEGNVAAEGRIAHVSLEFSAVSEAVGFVAFAGNVGPEIDARMELLINRCAVGNRFGEREVSAASHGLDAERGEC